MWNRSRGNASIKAPTVLLHNFGLCLGLSRGTDDAKKVKSPPKKPKGFFCHNVISSVNREVASQKHFTFAVRVDYF